MMKNKINKEVVLGYLKKIVGVWDNPLLSKPKNIFAWVGVFTTLYLVFFFSFTRPQNIKESQDRINQYEKEIKDFNKQISKLEKERLVLESEVTELETELKDLSNKSDKNKQKYEREVRYISNLSHNELSELFADTFKEPR
jgi:septal ring factor EnvC (AmiA/AmiB activator)